jgi:predicted MFS family arabinose efflux permease
VLAALSLRPFRRLLLAYGVNATGNYLGEVALALLVFARTHDPLAVALLMVSAQLLPALVGPALVAALQGVASTRLLWRLHLAEAAIVATLVPLGARTPLVLVLAAAFADGALGLVARATLKSTVVAVARPRGLLAQGNALLNVAFAVAVSAGPAVAGLVVSAFGVGPALSIDALSFLCAAAALRVGLPEVRVERTAFRSRLRAGFAHIREVPVLRQLFALDLSLAVVFALILPVEVVYVTDTLGASVEAYGVVLAAWGGGAIVGSVALARISALATRAVLLVALAVVAGSYVAMGASDSIALVAFFSLVGGIGNGIEGGVMLTLIQERTAERFQSSVNGLLESIHVGAPGVGFIIGGLLTAGFSTRATYLVAGCAGLLVIGVAALRFAGAVRPARLVQRSSSAMAPS